MGKHALITYSCYDFTKRDKEYCKIAISHVGIINNEHPVLHLLTIHHHIGFIQTTNVTTSTESFSFKNYKNTQPDFGYIFPKRLYFVQYLTCRVYHGHCSLLDITHNSGFRSVWQGLITHGF